MNSFLHQLDLELEKVVVSWGGTQVFYYARYADDMVFGIPRGEESSDRSGDTAQRNPGSHL
jgi:hypothetical protein